MAKSPTPSDDTKTDDSSASDAPKTSAKAKTIPVLLKRDYWAGEDIKDQWMPAPEAGDPNRIPAGTVLNLDGKEARRLMQAGVAERADALPDEE